LVRAQRPVLIAVGGWPGAGKTTLAYRLGERVGLPVFTKDDVKERLFDTIGVGDRAWSKRLGRASIAILEHQLEATLAAGNSVIGECNWDPRFSEPQLRAILERTSATAFVVAVQGDAEVIRARYRKRADDGERHPGHLDDLLVGELAEVVVGPYTPPALGGGRIDVDLTDVREPAMSAALDAITQALEVAAPYALENRPDE
jgi:predicted kinase